MAKVERKPVCGRNKSTRKFKSKVKKWLLSLMSRKDINKTAKLQISKNLQKLWNSRVTRTRKLFE